MENMEVGGGFWNPDQHFILEEVEVPQVTAESCSMKQALDTVINQLDLEEFVKNPVDYVDEQLYFNVENTLMLTELNCDPKECHLVMLNALSDKFINLRARDQYPLNIPSLNDDTTLKVSNGQVVTFRCMIQDELGQEFVQPVPAAVETTPHFVKKKSSFLKNGDGFDVDRHQMGKELIMERDAFLAVNPPGETKWVTDSSDLSAEVNRIRLNDERESPDAVALPNYKQIAPEVFENLAPSETKPVACVLKIYKSEKNHIKHNDLLEVVGVIYLPEESDGIFDELDGTDDIMLSKLPVLHVFSIIKLANGNPRVPILNGRMYPIYDTINEGFHNCPQQLIDIFTAALSGDRYSAMYLTSAVIARLFKKDPSTNEPLGRLVVNIYGIDKDSGIPQAVAKALQALLPQVVNLDITIDALNKMNLQPKKNLSNEHLEPGLLQMASGTQVLINETGLEEGRCEGKGTSNFLILKQFLEDKEVAYDYTYQHPKLMADVPVIILSKSISIFWSDICMKYAVETPAPPELIINGLGLLGGNMWKLRDYLTIAKTIPLQKFPTFLNKEITNDVDAYLSTRTNNDVLKSYRMNRVDMNAFIVACRLQSVLGGSVSIDSGTLKIFQDLDQVRTIRRTQDAL